jgi:hypothetical protein
LAGKNEAAIRSESTFPIESLEQINFVVLGENFLFCSLGNWRGDCLAFDHLPGAETPNSSKIPLSSHVTGNSLAERGSPQTASTATA